MKSYEGSVEESECSMMSYAIFGSKIEAATVHIDWMMGLQPGGVVRFFGLLELERAYATNRRTV